MKLKITELTYTNSAHNFIFRLIKKSAIMKCTCDGWPNRILTLVVKSLATLATLHEQDHSTRSATSMNTMEAPESAKSLT